MRGHANVRYRTEGRSDLLVTVVMVAVGMGTELPGPTRRETGAGRSGGYSEGGRGPATHDRPGVPARRREEVWGGSCGAAGGAHRVLRVLLPLPALAGARHAHRAPARRVGRPGSGGRRRARPVPRRRRRAAKEPADPPRQGRRPRRGSRRRRLGGPWRHQGGAERDGPDLGCADEATAELPRGLVPRRAHARDARGVHPVRVVPRWGRRRDERGEPGVARRRRARLAPAELPDLSRRLPRSHRRGRLVGGRRGRGGRRCRRLVDHSRASVGISSGIGWSRRPRPTASSLS